MSGSRGFGLGRWSRTVRVRTLSWLSELGHAGSAPRLTFLGFRAARNWGDALNPVLIEMLSGRPPRCVDIPAVYPRWRLQRPDDERYLVVGSTLRHADRATVVWGAGFLWSHDRPIEPPRRICAVRGPLSRHRLLELGIPCPEVFGDPALLFPRFYRPPVTPRYALGVVPHFADRALPVWKPLRRDSEVLIIDINAGIRQVVDQVCSCRRIASTSLHGLVLADAYGIPSVWLRCSDRVWGDGFKFLDHFAAVGRRQSKPVEPRGPLTRDQIEGLDYERGKGDGLDALLAACPFRKAEPDLPTGPDPSSDRRPGP